MIICYIKYCCIANAAATARGRQYVRLSLELLCYTYYMDDIIDEDLLRL